MRRQVRLLSLCLLPLLAAGCSALAGLSRLMQPAAAALVAAACSAPIRSAPMRGGYGGGYRGGHGGGIGFPFPIPFFGFGGGGLFGFLILMAPIGVVVNGLRGATGGGGMAAPSCPPSAPMAGPGSAAARSAGQCPQLAGRPAPLCPHGRHQQQHRQAQVPQDATLALLRHPDQCRPNSNWVKCPSSAEATFNRLSMQERSKLSSELTSNVDGRRMAEDATASAQSGDADATSEYIAVTLLVASRNKIAIKGVDSLISCARPSAPWEPPASELLALEVIWRLDGAGDVLSADEPITAYPQLKHL